MIVNDKIIYTLDTVRVSSYRTIAKPPDRIVYYDRHRERTSLDGCCTGVKIRKLKPLRKI